MNQLKLRRRAYILLGVLALVYTLIGIFLSSAAVVGDAGSAPENQVAIQGDPRAMGVFVLITGLASLLLLVFLARRAKA